MGDRAAAAGQETIGGEPITYCVTGATGYIGSWLVKLLLERGYRVHATARDPAKSVPLLRLWGGGDRLRLFKADLEEEGSFDEAVEGCHGVFHVAAPMEFILSANENSDSWVEEKVTGPAIKGSLNILKACLNAKFVKRVVFTSSISTLTAKDDSGNWRSVVDETCQNPINHVWRTKSSGRVYVLSKLFSENAAFQFAQENNIDLVSVITTTVGGPFLTSTVPSSIQVFLSPITGNPGFYGILSAVQSRMGSIALVHTEDICRAHIFLMQHSKAEGRYICCAKSCGMPELVNQLAKEYPSSDIQKYSRHVEEENGSVPSEISSRKLRDLGFTYKYGLQDIVRDTVKYCVDYGFLPPIQS